MPNAGDDREAYIASKVQEASKHPKAVLLGAIGAMCASPNEAANMASDEDLGLSNEEIQFARWVFLLKRSKTRSEFLKRLLDLTQTEKGQEERKMKVIRGTSYYGAKARERLEEVLDWISANARREIQKRGLPLQVSQYRPDIVKDAINGSVIAFPESTEYKETELLGNVKMTLCANPNRESEFKRWQSHGWPELDITITDKKLFYLAQAVGKAYERRTGRECVTIIRNYSVKK